MNSSSSSSFGLGLTATTPADLLGTTATATLIPFGAEQLDSYQYSSSSGETRNSSALVAANRTTGELELLAKAVESSLIVAQNKYGPLLDEKRRPNEEDESTSTTTTTTSAGSNHMQQHHTRNHHQTAATDQSMMISKTPEGQYYVFNNITLKVCRDVLKPFGVDRCTLIDYVDDCANDEGIIDYVAFFFCAFSPDKLPLALFISVSQHQRQVI